MQLLPALANPRSATTAPTCPPVPSHIFKAMPKMLADGGQRSVKEEMRDIIEVMTAKTWKRDKRRLSEILRSMG